VIRGLKIMTELLFKEEVYKIIGCAIEVHKELGPGFLEAIYHEAMEIEMNKNNISYISQPKINVFYKGEQLKKYYEPDFLVDDKIVIEIKSEKKLTDIDKAQIFNSIKCCKMRLGLLINIGEISLKWKRFVAEKYFK
jgi:GxxExxY protein